MQIGCWWDVLQSAWRVAPPCSSATTSIQLTHFRSLTRLLGSESPPIWNIEIQCPACEDQHHILMNGTVLDWAPLMDPLPPHFDVLTQRMEWAADECSKKLELSLRQGNWPLQLRCYRHGSIHGWPSLLQRIEPDNRGERFLATHGCPHCSSTSLTEMTQSQLQFHL